MPWNLYILNSPVSPKFLQLTSFLLFSLPFINVTELAYFIHLIQLHQTTSFQNLKVKKQLLYFTYDEVPETDRTFRGSKFNFFTKSEFGCFVIIKMCKFHENYVGKIYLYLFLYLHHISNLRLTRINTRKRRDLLFLKRKYTSYLLFFLKIILSYKLLSHF